MTALEPESASPTASPACPLCPACAGAGSDADCFRCLGGRVCVVCKQQMPIYMDASKKAAICAECYRGPP